MSKPEPNGKRQDDDRWADVRNRFGDIYKENPENARRSGRWATLRDRLGIAAVILALAVLGASGAASSRVDSSSSGVDDLNGKSRNASTRQKASAIIRSTRLSGAAGVIRA